jgi:tetratricopeptide (TPR) repeat protein
MSSARAASCRCPLLTRARAARCLLIAAATLGAPASSGSGQPSPESPPLPFIAAEAFPEASRPAIVGAFRVAHERPADANAVGALAMQLQAWEQFEIAAAAYRRAQALSPDDVAWWYLGGLTDTARALPADAARQFARAATLAPDRRALVALRLADARLAAGADDEAAALYRDLIGIPDHAAAAWYGLGRIALRRHDDAAARDALQQAVALYPDFAAAHYALALVQRRVGDADAAMISLARQQRCPACGPVPNDPWQARVAALRDDAFAMLIRGLAAASASTVEATADAIRLHEAALDRRELRAQAHVNLIELYRRSGDTERARQHYLAALDDAGFQAEAHRQYAIVLLEQQQVDDALRLFERAIALAPGDAAAWRGRGLASERLGRLPEAAAAYAAALDLAPDDHQARFGVARLAMRAGRVDEATVHLETLRSPPHAETPRYLFALSTAYLRGGRKEEAIRVANEALALARQLGDERMASFIASELRKLGLPP